jgi:hypothetical protein
MSITAFEIAGMDDLHQIAIAARETEALNLDRRPLILSIFTNLAEASRD